MFGRPDPRRRLREAASRLDEIATLSSPAQDRLLRAVEYGEVTRIGASRPVDSKDALRTLLGQPLGSVLLFDAAPGQLADGHAFGVLNVLGVVLLAAGRSEGEWSKEEFFSDESGERDDGDHVAGTCSTWDLRRQEDSTGSRNLGGERNRRRRS